MRQLTTLLALFLFAPAAHAGSADCRQTADALKVLSDSKDPDERQRAGVCLVRYQLDRPEVARAVLRVLRDPGEDTLLREDLIEALADAPLRKKVRIEGPKTAPQLGRQDQAALDRTASAAQGLLAVTQSMGSMEDTAPVSSYEAEFFKALSEIAVDEGNHVLLRACAVAALEKISTRVVESGVFDEKSLRLTRETLRAVSARDDEASYFTDAGAAYTRLASAGLPGFSRETPTRMISSVKPGK